MAIQEAPPAAPELDSDGSDLRRTTLVEHFRRQIRERGTAPALCFHSGGRYASISWADFGRAARRWSAYLLEEQVQPQQHVGIWAANRPEWHIADIGVLSVRCRPVPVYLTYSADQGGYVLGHSEAVVAVVENPVIRDKVLAVRQSLPALRRIVVMEGQDAPSQDGFVISWQDALDRGDTVMEQRWGELEERANAVTLDDIATLIYTSGTTGPPKAVLITHANVAAALWAFDEFSAATPSTRIMSHLPLAHIAERVVSEFRSYAYGHPVYFVESIGVLGARLREARPNMFFTVPRVWEKMAQQLQQGIGQLPAPRRALARWALRRGEDAVRKGRTGRDTLLADRLVLRRLRQLVGLDQATILATAAAPIGIETLRFFRSIGLELLEEYGQTEDTGAATINRPGHIRLETVGKPLRGTEVHLAEDGEILVRGGTVFAGYHKDPQATAETIRDGWLLTGDVGEFDEAGYLRITDRKKDLIITAGGKNIAPSNIETELQKSPLIAHAVVIGDRRPFVSALLTLDPEGWARFAEENGMPGNPDEVLENPTVLQAVQSHVDAVNGLLSNVEQVKKWELLLHDFQVGDELTPTLKVRRKIVAEKYAEQIAALYGT
jgi:long-chain acyl-CoA synthetase